MLRCGCCVLDDGNLKPLFDQFAQMGFDAHIGEHSAKDYFADSTLAQLKYEVVCFWSPNAMWRDNDGLAVLNIGLEALQPVSARAYKALKIQDSFSGEQTIVELLGLQRTVELPSLVDGKEIMRRNEDFEIVRFRGLENTLHVFDGVVFFETFVQERPGFSRLAQNFILGVDEDHRCIGIVNFHSSLALSPGGFVGILPACQGKREGHRGSANEFTSVDSRVVRTTSGYR